MKSRIATVGEFREWLLDDETAEEQMARAGRGCTGEIAAAVAKLSSNLDLITIGAKVRVVTKARTTVGLRGRLSTRLQPNHPRDDPDAIAASIYEGLAYGSGDALIGINPCIDEPDNLKRLLDLTARDHRSHWRADAELPARSRHHPDARARNRRADRHSFSESRRHRKGVRRFRNQPSRCSMRRIARFASAAHSTRPI